MLHHPDTQRTQKHKVNVLLFLVKLSALDVWVVRFFILVFHHDCTPATTLALTLSLHKNGKLFRKRYLLISKSSFELEDKACQIPEGGGDQRAARNRQNPGPDDAPGQTPAHSREFFCGTDANDCARNGMCCRYGNA